MQKWEYLQIAATSKREWDSMMEVHSVNGKSLKPRRDYIEYVNQLGEIGWELVAVDAGKHIFKRPKE